LANTFGYVAVKTIRLLKKDSSHRRKPVPRYSIDAVISILNSGFREKVRLEFFGAFLNNLAQAKPRLSELRELSAQRPHPTHHTVINIR